MANLLYVCKENRHRSFMAQVITETAIVKIAKEGGLESNLVIDSAGLVDPPEEYYGANEDVVKALEELGYGRHEWHHPKMMEEKILEKQDLVLCFKSSHVDRIKRFAPGLTARVTTLSEYSTGKDEEIENPEETLGRTILYPLMNSLNVPLPKRIWVYNNLRGITDERDSWGRVALLMETGRQIERYIDDVVQKLIKEGLVFSEPVV